MLFNNITCILLKRIGHFDNIYVPPCGFEMLFNNITYILLESMSQFECSNLYGGTYMLLKYISNYTNLHDGTMLIKKHPPVSIYQSVRWYVYIIGIYTFVHTYY